MDSETVAQGISFAFVPPIIAAPTFLTLLITTGPPNLLLSLLICIVFGTVVPLGVLIALSRAGAIHDLYASRREERTIPFLAAMFSYLLGAIVLVITRAPSIISAAMLCYLGNTLTMMVITLRWKISVHASGVTGPVTALVYSLGMIAFPFMVLVVPVGWARLRLGAHDLAQVLAGALLTIATTWVQLVVYLRFL